MRKCRCRLISSVRSKSWSSCGSLKLSLDCVTTTGGAADLGENVVIQLNSTVRRINMSSLSITFSGSHEAVNLVNSSLCSSDWLG